MKLLRTMYYPVDVENKIIYIEPVKREKDLAYKWKKGSTPCIAMRGAHLMDQPVYQEQFTVKRTRTMTDVIREWEHEAKERHSLWKGVARHILEILGQHPAAEAMEHFRRERRACRKMAVSAYYARAARDMKDILAQEAQAA